MLIKYQTSVINLNRVTEFFCAATLRIKFIFDSYDKNNGEISFSEFEFDSEEERENAFYKIIASYGENLKITNLD